MFICTMRATTLRLVGVLTLGAALLVSLAVWLPRAGAVTAGAEEAAAISYTKIRTEEDRLTFLRQFGLTPTGDAEEEDVRIPAEFDRVFSAYNEIQKRQGLDLTRYAGRRAKRYTYRLPDEDGREVYATVILYKNRVIGGDVCSPGQGGYVKTLERK